MGRHTSRMISGDFTNFRFRIGGIAKILNFQNPQHSSSGLVHGLTHVLYPRQTKGLCEQVGNNMSLFQENSSYAGNARLR